MFTISALTAEIRDNNIRKGFRPAGGGPGANTWGDYCSLLMSEVAEITEAFRDYKLADATSPYDTVGADTVAIHPAKPRGVGSEVADCIIRTLDMADVFGLTIFRGDLELSEILPADPVQRLTSFGDWTAWLGSRVTAVWRADRRGDAAREHALTTFLNALVAFADRWGIGDELLNGSRDLTREVVRKMAYNATRPYQHGGRVLADVMQAPVTRNQEGTAQ
jgi:hypothetical protein